MGLEEGGGKKGRGCGGGGFRGLLTLTGPPPKISSTLSPSITFVKGKTRGLNIYGRERRPVELGVYPGRTLTTYSLSGPQLPPLTVFRVKTIVPILCWGMGGKLREGQTESSGTKRIMYR